jgi:hypothetical protein
VLRISVTGVVVGTLVLAAAPLRAQERAAVAPRVIAPSGSMPQGNAQILRMQNALETAVTSGASDVLTQMSRVTQVQPYAQLQSRPQAHGFELPGYGTVFYVRVPKMSGVVLYALPALLKAQVRVDAQGRTSGALEVSTPGAAVPPVSPVDGPATGISPEDLDVLRDPDPHYVQAVRAALIDSMLADSRGLRVTPDEHLTVAAREDDDATPLYPDRLKTMLFTVRGSDLADYHQGRLTLEEARALVTVTTD